jgi:ribosome-binding factor A
MTLAGHRAERIAGEIRSEVSMMLAGELGDPRLAGPLEITEVQVSPDIRQARVFVRIPGTEAERASTFKGLNAASTYIRRELVERLQLRRPLEMQFLLDDSADRVRRIDELLGKVNDPGAS